MNERSASEAGQRAASLRQLVADAQTAQLDVEPFMALHTPEAVIVNIAGRCVLGGDELRRAMEQALATPLQQVLTTADVNDIRFVRPDVAIVSCTKHVADEREQGEGESSLPTRGSLTYVAVEDDGQWRIALAQTTPVLGS